MSHQITIVGLGPGDPRFLTAEASAVLSAAEEIYLRTRQHPIVAALPGQATVRTFDAMYESAGSFADLYQAIADRVLELGERSQGVVYAVPGHPLVGETSVRLIIAKAQERGIPIRLVDGLSFIEPILTALHLDALTGLQIADALDVAAQHSPLLDPDRPALLGQLYSPQVASDTKLTLLNVYPAEHMVTLIRSAGMPQQEIHSLPLHEIDRHHVDHLTSLFIPALPQPGSLLTFQELIAHLRSPMGCPWDREQTHASLRPHLLEETYEVLAALDMDDPDELKGELGDLLLQIMLHTQIASDCGEFTMPEVVAHIVEKLRRRHPHVFGATAVEGTDEILRNWEEIKRAEKGTERLASTFEGVSNALPALARAQAISDRGARVGFGPPDLAATWRDIDQGIRELRQAQDAKALGDLLFSLASLAHRLDIDAESALREAIARFVGRAEAIEAEAIASGRQIQGLSPAEINQLWQQTGQRSPDTT